MGESGDCLTSCMQITWFLCGELEEDLRRMVGQFAKICRRGQKVNVNGGKSKVMELNGEMGFV